MRRAQQKLTCHNVSFCNRKNISGETCIVPFQNEDIGLYSTAAGVTRIGSSTGYIKLQSNDSTGAVCLTGRDRHDAEKKLSIECVGSLRGTDSNPIEVHCNLNCGQNVASASDFIFTDTGVSMAAEVVSLRATIASLETQVLTLASKLQTACEEVCSMSSMRVFVDSLSGVIQLDEGIDGDDGG